MKILNSIYSQLKLLSRLSSRILIAAYCIFCALLITAAILMLIPKITGSSMMSYDIADRLLHASTRLLTLGVMTAFASDIVIRK